MPLVPVLAICFVATLVRSTFGFGESLLAVPLLALVIPLEVAVPLATSISILVAAVVLVQDHEAVDFHSAKWLVAFALLGIPIGVGLLVYTDALVMKLTLGALLVAYSVYALLRAPAPAREHSSRWWLFGCGLASGVLGGAYGINGPALVIYANLRRWNARQFRSTLQAYFLPASLAGLAAMATKGLFDHAVALDLVLCLPAIVPAVVLGRYLNRRLEGASFFKYVYLGLIVVGVSLVATTLRARA